MLRHCVMFTFNEGVAPETIAEIRAGLDELAMLDCVAAYRHGPDAGLSEGNWDYVVVGDFESDEAYQQYAEDEGHLTLIADVIRPNINGRAAVQYRL